MEKILEIIQQHSGDEYFCYGFKKVSLGDNTNDVLSFDGKLVFKAKKSIFAKLILHSYIQSPSAKSLYKKYPIFRFF